MKWQAKVYKPRKEKFDPEEWERIEIVIFTRDDCTCQACYKRKKSLTVHHIIPRIEGGSDDLDNLVTLCRDCHNEIEDMNIRCLWEIKGRNKPERVQERMVEERRKRARYLDDLLSDIDAQRPAWHAKVYGGG